MDLHSKKCIFYVTCYKKNSVLITTCVNYNNIYTPSIKNIFNFNIFYSYLNILLFKFQFMNWQEVCF